MAKSREVVSVQESVSVEIFRILAANAKDVAYRYRFFPDRGFEFVSPAVTEMTGYTPEEHYADPDLSLKMIHPEDRPRLEHAIENLEEIFKVSDLFTSRWIRKDGTVIWTEQKNVPVYDEAGRVVAIEGIIRDITSRKEFEAKWRVSERLLSRVMSQLPGFLYRRTKTANWTITHLLSPGAVELTGYNAADLIGDKHLAFSELIHPDDRNQVRQAFEDAVEFSGSFDVSYRIVTRDGRKRWVSDRGHRVGGGEILEGLLVDITERKNLEEQLMTSQRMESLGTLAAGVAHDFNNILTGINGYAEILSRKAEESSTYDDLQVIVDLSSRAARLVRQLLVFSKSEAINPRVLDVNTIIRELSKLWRSTLGENITLETSLCSEPAVIKADPAQIEQVLMNLVVNAKDAMSAGGNLSISTRVLSPSTVGFEEVGDSSPSRVQIRVTDTGCGMDEKTQTRIFEPFFSTKKHRGTGLGLSTVYGIVSQHHGQINVKSSPRQGTTFDISFDLCEEPEVEDDSEQVSQADPGSGKLLVLEDEPAVGAVIQRSLEESGYTVLLASSPDKARQMAQKNPELSLLLFDVVLPGMSGPDTADRILDSIGSKPVLFISGYAEADTLQKRILKRQLDFLSKPFTPAELVTKVQEILGKAAGKN